MRAHLIFPCALLLACADPEAGGVEESTGSETSGLGTSETGVSEESSTESSGTTGRSCEPSGALDLAFGVEGVLTLDGSPAGDDEPVQVAFSEDGMLLVAAGLYDGADGVDVHRFDSTGLPDPTFGDAGKVTVPSKLSLSVHGIGFDAAARIYVMTVDGVFRLTPDGEIDFDYGTDGVGLGAVIQRYGFAVADDGAILIAGMIDSDEGTGYEGAVARISPDGLPDMEFGEDGHFEIFENSANALTRFFDVAIFDDRIIAAGESDQGFNYFVGLTPSGQLQPAFAGNGTRSMQVGESADVVRSVAINGGRGEISWVGFYRDSAMLGGGTGTSIGRLNATGGDAWPAQKIQSPATENYPHTVAVLPDGDQIFGATYSNGAMDLDMVVVRVSNEGEPVTDFGDEGVAGLAWPSRDTASDLDVSPDGHAVVTAGVASTNHDTDREDNVAIVARFLVDDCE